jgi:hypothetical protein
MTSAIGTKRTWRSHLAMSAFGGKADTTRCLRVSGDAQSNIPFASSIDLRAGRIDDGRPLSQFRLDEVGCLLGRTDSQDEHLGAGDGKGIIGNLAEKPGAGPNGPANSRQVPVLDKSMGVGRPPLPRVRIVAGAGTRAGAARRFQSRSSIFAARVARSRAGHLC